MSETEAQRRANLKYRKKAYENILLRLRVDRSPTKQEITEAAKDHGESVNEFIITAITNRINKGL